MKIRSEKLLLLLSLLVLFAGGCAYFNTYYNAQRYYDEGVRDIEQGQGGRARAPKLNESLKVASRVLEFYPDSRWVDDALLLMGKSYFYLQNYYNALRKFEELREQFPESELIPECDLWQAKTLLELQEYDEAKTWLVLITAGKAPRDVWVESRMVLGIILQQLENWEQAATAYSEVVDGARDKRLRGRALYQHGLVSLQMNKLEQAAQSFARVGRFHPGVEIERRSSLGRIDAEIRLQNYRLAEKLIERGLKDEHFFEEWDEFELKTCLLLEEQHDLSGAIDCYRQHLEEYSRLESTATACFRLGSIYLLHYDQPDSALKYFDQVSQEQRESIWSDSTAILMSKLDRLMELLDDLSGLDHLLLTNSDAMDPARLREVALWERVRAYRQAEADLADSLAMAAARAVADSLSVADSLAVGDVEPLTPVVADSLVILPADSLIAGRESSVTGEEDTLPLSVTELPAAGDADTLAQAASEPLKGGEVDTTALILAESRSRARLPVFEQPGSRKISSIPDSDTTGVVTDSVVVVVGLDSLQIAEQKHLDTMLFHSFLDTALFTAQIDSVGLLATRDSLRLAWGAKIMTLGELYLLEMYRLHDADSLMIAVDTTWLSPRQLVHRRWFIGWMREREGDSLAARTHYDQLLELYPLSEEAKYLRIRLGLPVERSAEDYAAEMCRQAELMWDDSLLYLDAIGMYREVVRLFPETTVAPRALLAEAWLYSYYLENQTQSNAALQLLTEQFPGSPEAEVARRWQGAETTTGELEQAAASFEEEVLQNLLEPQQDESGRFIRNDAAAYLTEKIENFQEHMLDIGVIRVHRILK